jgi:O-antigen ligase
VNTVQPLVVRRRIDPLSAGVLAIGAAVVLALFLAVGALLARNPVPLPLVLVFGVGLLGTLALALARYDAAVGLGILLLAVVRIEPAPSDLVFAVVIALAFVTGRLALQRVPLSVTLLVSAFFALNLLASVVATDTARAAMFFGITLYLGIFGLWLAAYVRSVRRARLVVVTYVAAAAFSAAVSCLALFVPFPGGEAFVSGPRAQGLFKDPNVFGPFLVPAVLIMMEETVAPRLLRFRLATKLMLVSILTVGVVFSFSRAAWLNLAVGGVVLMTVLVLRRGAAHRALAVAAAGLVAGVVLLGALHATGSLAFLQERAGFQAYDAERFEAQRSGLEIAAAHPLGIGPGQFERVSDISAHSTYVRALAEQGVLGVLLMLALMLLTLGFAVRNVTQGVGTYGIGSAALLAAWCGLVANSFFVDTLHWRHLWLIAALVWAGTAFRTGYAGR